MLNHEIEKAITNDKLIFMVGSGFSKVFDFPDWKGLVIKILEKLKKNDAKYEGLLSTLQSGLFTEIEVLEKLYNERRMIYSILEETFKINQEQNEKLLLHKKIGEISGKIITTNYDEALEKATSFKKIVYDSDFRLATLSDYKEFVFKLHGCIEHDPSNCILFKKDYEKLYDNSNAAIEKLKSLIADHTIIFLGFSFSDPYVKKQFEYIHNIFKGLSNRHFIITTDKIDLSEYGIEALNIENWSLLPNLLNEFINLKDQIKLNKLPMTIPVPNKTTMIVQQQIKVALLIPQPIDRDMNIHVNKLIHQFEKYDINLDYLYLSIESLRSLEQYDYIFIFTKIINNKYVIEDEYLKSKLLTLKELEQQIGQDKCDGLFIFVDKYADDLEGFNANHPTLVITNFKKDISSFIFSVFQRKNLDFENYFVFNKNKFNLDHFKKGKSRLSYVRNNIKISDQIDPRAFMNFVGRKTDLEDIIRKIIDSDDQILTIKGSGGIGKTTVVKKAVFELFSRGLFADGVYFIECEFIQDYQTFEYKIAQCFSLDSSINLKDHIKSNEIYIKSIIILDNFEPLIYNKEFDEMKDLVSFISGYSKVIITTRDKVGLEFELMHDLRSFTTDESFELFEKYFPGTVKEKDIKLLKEDILETLLNNNPLAIKIICGNSFKSKTMQDIKSDLENHFFSILSTDFEEIFDKSSDRNIERSKSLFQSVNYSFVRLVRNERLLFEILSLFPDGININNIKIFFQKNKNEMNKITDREIVSLENKSLIEISGGTIKLQSIVGRFAYYQFNKRDKFEKSQYYERAFELNDFLVNSLLEKLSLDETNVLKIFDKNTENYLKCVSYLDEFNEGVNESKIIFMCAIIHLFIRLEQTNKLLELLSEKKSYFSDTPFGELCLEIASLNIKYYQGDFEYSLKRIDELMSLGELNDLDINSKIQHEIFDMIMDINKYSRSKQVLELIERKKISDKGSSTFVLFHLGHYNKISKIDSIFIKFEISLNLGRLDIEKLDIAIKELYSKQYIDMMQLNYIKSKYHIVDKKTINKLVITNPYTEGLKNLMFAFIETETHTKIFLFENAISKLRHITYYYVEAIYFYSKFLFEINSDRFAYWFKLGAGIAEESQYKFLVHIYSTLLTNGNIQYIELDYANEEYSSIEV